MSRTRRVLLREGDRRGTWFAPPEARADLPIRPRAKAAQVRKGTDPRASASANAERGEANASHHRLNRQWAKEHPKRHDPAWFLREVTPKLDALSLGEIAKATGLSLAACLAFASASSGPRGSGTP
jgi:hypothetical protein